MRGRLRQRLTQRLVQLDVGVHPDAHDHIAMMAGIPEAKKPSNTVVVPISACWKDIKKLRDRALAQQTGAAFSPSVRSLLCRGRWSPAGGRIREGLGHVQGGGVRESPTGGAIDRPTAEGFQQPAGATPLSALAAECDATMGRARCAEHDAT